MIQLKTKKSFNKWIDMGDGVSCKLDYPSMTQEQKLQDISLGGSQIGLDNIYKTMQYYIKYCIKDMKGEGEKGEAVMKQVKEMLGDRPLVTFDGLDDEVWWAMVKIEEPEDVNKVKLLYTKIKEELEFTEADKKK